MSVLFVGKVDDHFLPTMSRCDLECFKWKELCDVLQKAYPFLFYNGREYSSKTHSHTMTREDIIRIILGEELDGTSKFSYRLKMMGSQFCQSSTGRFTRKVMKHGEENRSLLYYDIPLSELFYEYPPNTIVLRILFSRFYDVSLSSNISREEMFKLYKCVAPLQGYEKKLMFHAKQQGHKNVKNGEKARECLGLLPYPKTVNELYKRETEKDNIQILKICGKL